MLSGILARWRERRRLRRGFPPAWRPWLEALPFHSGLDEEARSRLEDRVRALLLHTSWEGCGGLEMTDEIRVSIAGQAALLVLGLPPEAYRRVRTVLVYPSSYRIERRRVSRGGVVLEGPAVHAGEAWAGGPVVLAWDSALHGWRDPDDGRNLVLHEFAHQLDLLDDVPDGTPPLAAAERGDWAEVLRREHGRLERDAARGRRSLLDPYGATDPAEFFAVATEVFFERPHALRGRHRELFDELAGFYRVDPRGWNEA